jgi:hypothetical protein
VPLAVFLRYVLFWFLLQLALKRRNLLQAAISNMGGIGGKPAWAWIFIIEGLMTILAGIASFFIIQDFPDTAKVLTEEERTFIIRRLQEDDQSSAAGEEYRMKYVWQSLSDRKTWLCSMFRVLI